MTGLENGADRDREMLTAVIALVQALAVLLAAIPDDDAVAVRAQADRDLVPYRSKMPAAQIEQLQKQYAHKKLLEKYGLPRLSLFYM